VSSRSRTRQLERLKGQLGAVTGHDRLFGAVGTNLPHLVEVRLDEIRPSPHQPRQRFEPEGIAALAESIERHGLLQPVIVRRGEGAEGWELVAGERRLRAARHLGWATIPALMAGGDPEELTLIENIQREDLHPLEEAVAVTRLMQRHGYTHEAVGRVLGKPRTTVGEIVSLTSLPDWLQDEARERPVARHLFVQLARIADPDEQKAAWEAVKNGASVRALKARRSALGPRPRTASVNRILAAVTSSVGELERLPVTEFAAEAKHRDALLQLRGAIDRLLASLDANAVQGKAVPERPERDAECSASRRSPAQAR
jgi:ParB family transcriptional regulator, chromosome partitioning protein